MRDLCGFVVWFVSGTSVKKVEDVMPIATGHEREELEAELEVIFFVLLSIGGLGGLCVCGWGRWFSSFQVLYCLICFF